MPGLDTLFKENKEASMDLEKISNPYDLDFSFNLAFSDNSKIDTAASSGNITVSNGVLALSSGTTGTAISIQKNTKTDINKVQVKVIGEDLVNLSCKVSVDGGNSWESVTLDALTTLTNSGRNLRLQLTLGSANVRISAAAVYFA